MNVSVLYKTTVQLNRDLVNYVNLRYAIVGVLMKLLYMVSQKKAQ